MEAAASIRCLAKPFGCANQASQPTFARRAPTLIQVRTLQHANVSAKCMEHPAQHHSSSHWVCWQPLPKYDLRFPEKCSAFGFYFGYDPSSFDKHPRDPDPNIMTLLCFLENPDFSSVGLHRIVGV